MAGYMYNGKLISFPDRLAEKLEKKVIPDLRKKDKDCVFIIDGPERGGKSTWAQHLGSFCAARLGTKFDISNICMTPQEFRNRVINSHKNDVVIYDEAHRGMASSRTSSEVNVLLRDLMMEMGQKNLLVIVVMPTVFFLDKYVVLFRARGLFHMYERKGKICWVFYNRKQKKKLYIYGKKELNYDCMKFPPMRCAAYLTYYVVGDDIYRAKKAKSFKEVSRNTKAEHYIAQRDSLIYFLSNEFKLTGIAISKAINPPVSAGEVRKIIAKMEEMPIENTNTSGDN